MTPLTIKIQRLDVAALLRDNPSLRARLDGFLHDAYAKAALQAAREIDVEETLFPEACPFTVEQILDDHWPDAAA